MDITRQRPRDVPRKKPLRVKTKDTITNDFKIPDWFLFVNEDNLRLQSKTSSSPNFINGEIHKFLYVFLRCTASIYNKISMKWRNLCTSGFFSFQTAGINNFSGRLTKFMVITEYTSCRRFI